MSLPLLLEWSKQGSGPQIPVKDEYDVLVVEGLASGCTITVDLESHEVVAVANGRFPIPKTAKGTTAQAKLDGCGSKAHAWLEKSNG